MNAIIEVNNLSHEYARGKPALRAIHCSIQEGEFFGFMGPNGGGKTTLFRILATLMAPQSGRLSIAGINVKDDPSRVRSLLGVVFQNPSLDKKLTIVENLKCHGYCYGLYGKALDVAISKNLERLSLLPRAREKVERLSGGLQRRVELAKALLHNPKILLLDEPTTGLDPIARGEFWGVIAELRQSSGVTVVATTHFLEEADRCDRIAIMDQGNMAVCDTPKKLKEKIGKNILFITTSQPETLSASIASELNLKLAVLSGGLRGYIEEKNIPRVTQVLMEKFSDQVEGIAVHKPNLEDVFYEYTGHAFTSHL